MFSAGGTVEARGAIGTPKFLLLLEAKHKFILDHRPLQLVWPSAVPDVVTKAKLF